jgi:cell division protein FtsZ
MVTNEADPSATIIWGTTFNDKLEDEMVVSVIATGFDDQPSAETPVAKSAFQQAKQARTANISGSTASKTTAAASAAAKPVSAVPTPHSSADDEYFDIMSIFNRRK